MAIGRQMPQDIFKYKAKFIAGFSARQTVFYMIGLFVGFVLFFKVLSQSPINIRSIGCAAGCLPFFLWGSVNPYGQPLEKVLVPFIQDNILSPTIRKKEIHFLEYEAEHNKQSEHAAKPSKEHVAIK